jgi:hypothetical protein
MKTTLLISLLVFSSSVFAYDRDSFVLYCEKGQSMALDYHEVKILRGRTVDWTGSGRTAQDKFEFLVGKIGERFPETSNKFKKWQGEFAQEALFISDADLDSSGAPLDLPIPNGCEIKAVITQRDKEFAEDRTYLVNKNLWDKLSPEAQAGALLNAFMSRDSKHTSEFGASYMNARDVRKWNAFFATNEYRQITTPKMWKEVLEPTKFEYWLDGLYSPGRSRFYENGSIAESYVNSSRAYKAQVQGRTITVKGYQGRYDDEKWGTIYLSRQGQIYKFGLVNDEEFSVGGFKYSGIKNLEIYSSGNIKQIEFKRSRRMKFGKFNGNASSVSFDEAGKITGIQQALPGE